MSAVPERFRSVSAPTQFLVSNNQGQPSLLSNVVHQLNETNQLLYAILNELRLARTSGDD